MKLIILLFLPFTCILSESIDNSFITKFEYGAMLYKNPRGIGCNKCHSIGNKKILISTYKDKKNITHSLFAPPVDKVTFKAFKKKLKAKRYESLIMPTYFLTNDEIESIYYYILEQNK